MEVVWTPFAKQQALEILTYAQANFGRKASAKLARSMEQNDVYLINNPQIGPIELSLTKKKEVYRYLMINKVFKELYYIKDEVIYIVAFWNCRQEPIRMHDMIEKFPAQ